MATIPASTDVAINPSIIGAGGAALNLTGLVLTKNAQLPMGAIVSFPLEASVATYFGALSAEADAATKYFAGFDGSTVKPASILFSRYADVNVAGFLRGGNVSALTLAQLQALTGTVILTVGGTLFTSATINLSGAASFSAAAALIQAGFTAPTFAVTYDSVSGGFVFTSTATGVAATMTYATGTLSASLLLTAATGATLSQGANATTPTAAMNAIVNQNTNWVSFMTMFDPDVTGNALKQEFATWANGRGIRYTYVCWDTDTAPRASANATSSLGRILAASASNGTFLISTATYAMSAFVCGMIASINTAATRGNITFKFKSQAGLTADITDATTAANLEANGYNYYGVHATANQSFNYMSPGSITGKYLWADAYIDEIWLDNSLQLAMLSLLAQVNSVPNDAYGTSLVRTACQAPINAAVNFGMISVGAALTPVQIAQVNAAAGLVIDKTLSASGYYLQVLAATPQQRAARSSPPINLWYINAGSMHKLSLASISIQ